MMSQFLQSVLDLFKSWDRGDLPSYPDPAAPSDLGSAMSQDDIDFVKSLRKEMTERFSTTICNAEKTDVAITWQQYNDFTTSWTNPSGFTGTQVTYRVQGDTEWLIPNATGNATGTFNEDQDAFSFTSGFTIGTTYEVRVQNECPNGILSAGVTVSAEAQDIAT